MNLKDEITPKYKMNSTNLYVTTTQIILKSDPRNPNTWQDLYRLIPYLRNSLCCVVCSNLLVDPLTPALAQCQHHLCRTCREGRKKIKPACEGCKDCREYIENKRLRILLQCYKKMCISLMKSPLFNSIRVQAVRPGTGFESGAGNLIMLIREGACFQDDYESSGGLPKSAYSILPCIYTNSAQPPPVYLKTVNDNEEMKVNNAINKSSFYSLLYPGSNGKLTLKRKSKDCPEIMKKITTNSNRQFKDKSLFKKPCNSKPKKGCRCGNATATPGKLTCCGQRCPCYVDSKPCVECKCRGCRNPHRIDGQKVMPHIPELQQLNVMPTSQPPMQIADNNYTLNALEDVDINTSFPTLELPIKTYKIVGSCSYNTVPLSSDILPFGFSDEDAEISVV